MKSRTQLSHVRGRGVTSSRKSAAVVDGTAASCGDGTPAADVGCDDPLVLPDIARGDAAQSCKIPTRAGRAKPFKALEPNTRNWSRQRSSPSRWSSDRPARNPARSTDIRGSIMSRCTEAPRRP